MKYRFYSTPLAPVAAFGLVLLMSGCASMSSSRPADAVDMVDTSTLPRITLPGARRADVKALAMGAARTKGWRITESTPGHFVAEQPIAQDSLMRLPDTAPGTSAAPAPGSKMIVTSYFKEQGDQVIVASRAELLARATNPSQAMVRTDYTEALSPSLTRSLASLKARWSANPGLLARATPPRHGWGDEVIERPSDDSLVADAAARPAAETPEPTAPDSQPVASNTPVAASTPPAAPAASSAVTRPQPAVARRPAPEPRRLQHNTAAPVVDASTQLGASPATPLTPGSDMLTLPKERIATPNSTALAEQYARAQGCQITGGGARLIESRSDGDIQQISCADSDSLYVRCQNGRCTGVF